MKNVWITCVVACVVFAVSGSVLADAVLVKLTGDALFPTLSKNEWNRGSEVDPDVPGAFVTSAVTGEGSILYVQQDGTAGPGAAGNPSLVTITAKEHLDVDTSGAWGGAPNDYHAGVIYISKESSDTPDGKNEGIGVRAFTIDPKTGLRVFDTEGARRNGPTGRAEIEGSKEVSGGTDSDRNPFDEDDANGAPHVDEEVCFDFDPLMDVAADSVVVRLSKFDHDPSRANRQNKIDLTVELASGDTIFLPFIGPGNDPGVPSDIFQPVGSNPKDDKVWDVVFDNIAGIGEDDLVESFCIRAVEDYPKEPRGTAEHFLITGFVADVTVVPVPAALVLGVMGLGLVGWGRKRFLHE